MSKNWEQFKSTDYRKNIKELKITLDSLLIGIEVGLGKTITPTDKSTLQSIKGLFDIFIAMNDNIASLREGVLELEGHLTIIDKRLKILESQLGDLEKNR